MTRFVSTVLLICACFQLSAAHAETMYVAMNGNDTAQGTAAAPWRTIQHGADALKPGDTLLIGPGLYREHVEVAHSGTAQAPIVIAAAPGARVVVTGADRLQRGWTKAGNQDDGIYSRDWAYRFPIGGPNELTHPGDREHMLTGRAEQVIHAGRLMRQVLTRAQVAPGTFFVDLDAKKLYVWLRGSDDPNDTEMEASVRVTWLTSPASYVTVRGIIFRYAANHAQRGALSIGSGGAGSRGWRVQDCIFDRANGSGASITGTDQEFLRCIFEENGQLGFGTSRCNNSRMVQCSLYRNNLKGYSTGWEAGGCKVTMSRGFVFDGCRSLDNRGVGIWFDIGNENSEVKNCTIADNDEAGIFYEISYGLHAHDNLIVNNANNGESVGGAWGSAGITISSSEDCVVEHNTLVGNRDGIAFREQDRSTPRIDAPEGSKGVRILNRNDVVRDNIIADSQAYNIALWMDTNFFGPHPSGGDRNRPIFEDPKNLNIQFSNNLLSPLPGRPNYLYGASWRPKSKQSVTPAEFTAASGIPDNSQIGDPLFIDAVAGNYALRGGSPAMLMKAGTRQHDPVLLR